MRVAIVAGPHIPVPPPAYGGTERVIAYLVRGLLEEGHEPILLASGDSQVECELIPIVDQAIGFPPRKQDLPEHEKLRADVERRTSEQAAATRVAARGRRPLPRIRPRRLPGLPEPDDAARADRLQAPRLLPRAQEPLLRVDLAEPTGRGTPPTAAQRTKRRGASPETFARRPGNALRTARRKRRGRRPPSDHERPTGEPAMNESPRSNATPPLRSAPRPKPPGRSRVTTGR